MQTTAKVFLACAFGAGIGSILALQFSPYFWWLGALIGGVLGYASYEFKRLVSAIKNAWAAVRSAEKETIYSGLYTGFGLSMITLSVFSVFFVISFMKSPADELLPLGIASLVSVLLFLAIGFALGAADKSLVDPAKTIIKYGNPVYVYVIFPFWCLYKVARGLLLAMQNTPAAVQWTGRLARNVFVAVHSDIRLLCGLDAMLGAIIGYFAANALLGAVAGGLIGVLHYYLSLQFVPSQN